MTNLTGLERKGRHHLDLLDLVLTTRLVAQVATTFILRRHLQGRLMTQHASRVPRFLLLNSSACSFGITCTVLMLIL